MSFLRQAKILYQAVSLVVEAFGITVAVSESVKSAIFEDTSTAIENSSKMQRAIQDFTIAWNEAGNDPFAKASAIVFLLKDSYAAGILWTIISRLFGPMGRLNWLKTAGKVFAMLVVSLAKNGVDLIGRIVVFGFNGSDLANSVKDMS